MYVQSNFNQKIIFHFQHSEVFEKDDLNDDDDKGVSETSRDVALINSDQSLVSTKEKSTQEKVRNFDQRASH